MGLSISPHPTGEFHIISDSRVDDISKPGRLVGMGNSPGAGGWSGAARKEGSHV